MAIYNTQDDIALISAKPKYVYLISLVMSFIFTNFFFLFFFIIKTTINLQIIINGVIIFGAIFFSIVFMRLEYIIAIKKEYKSRPPIHFPFMLIVISVLIFLALPNNFDSVETPNTLAFTVTRSSIYIIIPLIIIGSIVLTWILRATFRIVLIQLIKIVLNLKSKKILSEELFKGLLESKSEEVKRYGGSFSLLMITFTVPKSAENIVKQNMIFSLFFEILRKNMRKTDSLGIFHNGDIAQILSINTDSEKAELQATRIIDSLEENLILKKKLKLFGGEFKCGISEYKEDMSDISEITTNSRKALNIALSSEDKQIVIK